MWLFHALVLNVLSLRAEHASPFYSAGKRQAQLVDHISSELKDVEAGPELLHAAGEFLATLDNTVRDQSESRVRSKRESIALSDVKLDQL